MSYTPNPFDLLGEDGEDRPRRQAPKPPKQTSQPAPAKPQDSQQQKAAPAKPSPAPKKDDAKPKPQGDANKGKPDGAAAKKPAQPRQQQTERAPVAPRDPNYESEKPPRPTKDKRDGPNPRPIRKNGRQNDRLSGTGRPPNENKRRGAGSGNWGAVADGQEVAEAIKESQTEEKEEVVAPGEAEATAEPAKPEKEFKGLDEYYESIKDKGPKNIDQLKLRVAGEGVDQSAWAGFAPIKKDDESPSQLSKKKGSKSGKEEKPKEEKTKEEKVSIDKLFKVTLPPPQGVEERGQRGGRGGRGGKGPSRGGRTDRRPQNDRNNKAGFEHDPQNFPALGGGAPASPAAPAPAVAAPQANAPAAVKA